MMCQYGARECFACGNCEPDQPLTGACAECGESIDWDLIERGACPECRAAIVKRFADLIRSNFSADEVLLIEDATDGSYLSEWLIEQEA